MSDSPVPSDIHLRPGLLEDADRLFARVTEFATSFTPDKAAFEIALGAIVADPNAWLHVADDRGDLVGYCLGFDHPAFFANGRVAWVEEIVVRADRRRHGVGRALMGAFEDWAIGRGATLVSLATRRAATFYEALGYEESAVYYRKRL